MNDLRLFSGVFLVIFTIMQASFAGLEPSTIEAYKAATIPGLGKVYEMATMDGVIYLASQPPQPGLRQLKKLRIKTLINLRENSELSYNEEKAVKQLGIRYIHIPVNVHQFNVNSIQQFNKAIYSPKNYPIYIHCHSGERVAAMMALNNITQYRTPVDTAIQEAKHYGLTKPTMIEFVRDTVKKYNLNAK